MKNTPKTEPVNESAEATSSHPSVLVLCWRAVKKARQDQWRDQGAAIAFYTFFSIFPLLLGVISAAGYFLESEVARQRLYELVAQTFPGSSELLRENLEGVVQVRGALGAFGVLGLIWSGSSAFGAITRAVNRTLGAEKKQPFLFARLRYFAMTVAVTVLLVLSLAMTTVLEVVANLDLKILEKIGFEPSLFLRIGGWAASFLLVLLVFVLIYKVTPYVDVEWSQLLPGALLGAAIFVLGKRAFLFYVERATDFQSVYGSLSSIIVLLLWLRFSAQVIIFGAEYNIVRWWARTGVTAT